MLRAHPHVRAGLAAALVLLLAAVPVGLYLGHRVALHSLCRALTRGTGQRVTMGGIWGTLRPSIVVGDLRVGESAPLLTVHRAELVLELSPTRLTRPAVREVRLVRPLLRLTEDELRRWAAPAPAAPSPGTPSTTTAAALAAQVPDFTIEDGTLHVELPVRGHALRLRSDGIFLRAVRGETLRRVVVGRTLVALDGEELVNLAAAAADLDTRRRHRPTRVALLGGLLRAPGRAPGALLGLHSATLVEEQHGAGFELRLTGKPTGKGTGAISLRAHLGRDGRPAGPAAAVLRLRSADLTHLASLVEPLGLRVGGTRLSGYMTVAEDRGVYRARIQLQSDNLRLHHPLIASSAVGPFAGTVSGEIRLDPAQHRIRIRMLELTSGTLRLTLGGTITSAAEGQVHLALDLSVPETPCHKLLTSLPPGLAPKLAGMGLEGRLGLTARLVLDSTDLESSDVDVDVAPLTCRVVADPPDADPRALLGEVNVNVSGARGTGLTWPLGPSNPDFRPLARISRHVRSAFVVAEDSRFFRHRGFDGPQLRRAFLSNLREGRLARGASTISQQLVKNVFLDSQRSLSRKLQEAVLTWRLEQVVPKSRILELYLNVVEMGPGIYGVTQAARHYFGKLPSELSPLQAAHLAALTPSPRHLAQGLRDGDPGPAWFERVRMVLRMMRRSGAITPEAQQQAQAERLSLLKH